MAPPSLSREDMFAVVSSAWRLRTTMVGDRARLEARGLYLLSGRDPPFRSRLEPSLDFSLVGDTGQVRPRSQADPLRTWSVEEVEREADGRVTLVARVTHGSSEHFESFRLRRADVDASRRAVIDITIARVIYY